MALVSQKKLHLKICVYIQFSKVFCISLALGDLEKHFKSTILALKVHKNIFEKNQYKILRKIYVYGPKTTYLKSISKKAQRSHMNGKV